MDVGQFQLACAIKKPYVRTVSVFVCIVSPQFMSNSVEIAQSCSKSIHNWNFLTAFCILQFNH